MRSKITLERLVIGVIVPIIALVLLASCKSPTGPTPPPGPTLQLLDLKLGIADSSEIGAPLTGPVTVGTRVRYNLIFSASTGMSGLTGTFTTLCNGVVMHINLVSGVAGAYNNNRYVSEFTPASACNYTVQASIGGAIPDKLERSFEAK